jgi:hypothetical protein
VEKVRTALCALPQNRAYCLGPFTRSNSNPSIDRYQGIADTIVQLIRRSTSGVIAASQSVRSDERCCKNGLSHRRSNEHMVNDHRKPYKTSQFVGRRISLPLKLNARRADTVLALEPNI